MLSFPNQITSIKNFPKQITNNELKLEETKPNSFISTDSTNDSNINSITKNQKYIFENDNKSYSISVILFEEKIKILVYPFIQGKEESYYYEKDFSQNELKNINKVFKLCNSIEESYEYFNDLLKDQNHLIVKENNNFFNIEKKMKLSLPLKIEITKKYKNILNNFIQNDINNEYINIKDNKIKKNPLENISQLNNNNEIKDKINILEQTNNQLIELIKKKYLYSEERINNLSKNILIADKMVDFINEKNKEQNNNQINKLLNKKRTNISDISYKNNNNDNTFNNNKNKNGLDKEIFLKIFTHNNSANSSDTNEKFFMKILKKKKLEKENIHIEEDKYNNKKYDNDCKMNIIHEEGNETYLYGGQDSSDEIKDDIDFFSNNSPSITAMGPKNNNINNDSLFNLYNKEKNNNLTNLYQNENKSTYGQILFNKNINNNLNCSNYQNNTIIRKIQLNDDKKKYNEKIKNENNSIFNEDYSYNINDDFLFDKYSFIKRMKGTKMYKIIHKNSTESYNSDIFYNFQRNDNQIKNNIFSVNSKIISNYNEFDFIIIYLKIKFDKEIINSIRIYTATEDGDKADDFHRLCDGNTNIIVLIKTKDGKKIGGYTSIGFNNYNQSNLDDTAFIFSIDKREIYPNIKGKNAIESYHNLGPTFSGDIIKIYDNFLLKGGITSKNGTNFETNADFQINDGKKSFAVEEIEVLEFLELKINNNI